MFTAYARRCWCSRGKRPAYTQEESEQLVEILKKRGNVVDVVDYPSEGHGFDKVENQVDAARRIVAWFDKYLKNASSTPAATK